MLKTIMKMMRIIKVAMESSSWTVNTNTIIIAIHGGRKKRHSWSLLYFPCKKKNILATAAPIEWFPSAISSRFPENHSTLEPPKDLPHPPCHLKRKYMAKILGFGSLDFWISLQMRRFQWDLRIQICDYFMAHLIGDLLIPEQLLWVDRGIWRM